MIQWQHHENDMIKIADILQQEHKLTIPLQYIQSQGPVLAPDTFG